MPSTITRARRGRHAIDRGPARSGSWLGGDRDRVPLNAGQHRPKDDAVKRRDGVPIEQSGQAPRLEEGGLAERALRLSVRSHAKVQERLTRQFHLCAQGERAVPFDADHTPEIEGVAIAQQIGMPATPAQPRPPRPAIEPAAEPPQPAGAPAVVAADAAHRSKDSAARDIDGNLAHIAKDGAAGPVRIARHWTGRRPMGFHQVCLHLAERSVNCLPDVETRLRNEPGDAVVTTDDFVLQPFGQRTRNAMAQWRNELNPV